MSRLQRALVVVMLASLAWSADMLREPAPGRLDIWVPRGAKPTITAAGRTYNPCIRVSSSNVEMDLVYLFRPPTAAYNKGRDCASGLGLNGQRVRFIPMKPNERAAQARSMIAGLIVVSCLAVALVHLAGTILKRRALNV